MICLNCKKEFSAKRSTAKFCSAKCKLAYHRGSISVSDDTVTDTVRKADTLKGDTIRGVDTLNDTLMAKVDTLNDTLTDTVTPLVTPEGAGVVIEKLIMFGERLKKLEEEVQEHAERLAKVEEMMADLHTESARRSPTVKHTVKRQAEEVDELPFSKHRQATYKMGREID